MHQKKAKLLNLKKLKNYLYSNPWPTEGLRKGLNIKTGVKRGKLWKHSWQEIHRSHSHIFLERLETAIYSLINTTKEYIIFNICYYPLHARKIPFFPILGFVFLNFYQIFNWNKIERTNEETNILGY